MTQNKVENSKKQKIIFNKNEAMERVNTFLDKCIETDEIHSKKADLLSYWLKDYINYLEQEETFNPLKLKEYKRGDVIKVNLGFNVGNEEGGLHYCVVLDKKNSRSHSTVTVVPLTSIKPKSKKNNYSVFLGNELYKNLIYKARNLLSSIDMEKVASFEDKAGEYCDGNTNISITNDEIEAVRDSRVKGSLVEKIITEIEQMKTGSIALINQITTISKQRIYNPKKDFDILSGIQISDENMKLIDEKLKSFFIN